METQPITRENLVTAQQGLIRDIRFLGQEIINLNTARAIGMMDGTLIGPLSVDYQLGLQRLYLFRLHEVNAQLAQLTDPSTPSAPDTAESL